jgi:PAS domain S-box-containing protein
MSKETIHQLQQIILEKETELSDLSKICEKQLHTIQQLEEKQFNYEDILARVPSHVYWLDKNNVYLGCNDAHAQTIGISSRHEIVGKNNYDMPWREQADLMNNLNNQVMSTGVPIAKEEFTNIDGILKFYISYKTPLRNKYNEIIGILGISIDITERKKLEEELRLAKESAESASRAKTEFLANMRHDIRTPLSGIVGFSEILKSESQEQHIKAYADNLIASSHALLELLDEVLEAVKVSSGEIPLLKRKFDLKRIPEQVIALYSAKAQEKKITLNLNMDPKVPQFVIGDKIRMHRILLELVGNAINFTDKGLIRIGVELMQKKRRQLVIKLTVADTGVGIPKEKQQDIYIQFNRLTPSYQGIYKGAGLGLFVIKQFIEELEGEIYVESEPRKGTCFTCLIPLKEPLLNDDTGTEPDEVMKTTSIPPIETPRHSISTPELSSNARILVVEDNVIAQTVAQSLLVGLSCLVDIASNGLEAIELSNLNHYDLIFMDIGLGEGMDGFEVTRHLRNLSHPKHHIPIIALTAHAGDNNKQRCIEAGMDEVITKPLTQSQAINIIKTFIPIKQDVTLMSVMLAKKELPENNRELFNLEQYPLFDPEAALKNCGNNNVLVELLGLLISKEIPEDEQRIKRAFENNDYHLVEKIAHKIKSGAMYLGTTRMKFACQYVERYWKTGERELFNDLYHQAVKTIDDTSKYISEWLSKHPTL